DLNGNLAEHVSAEDRDGSTANNSAIAGVGDVKTIYYDGFDREARVVTAIGTEFIYNYDPAGNIVTNVQKGQVGGPSPTSNSTVNNSYLDNFSMSYDELNRLYEKNLQLVADSPLTRSVQLAEGLLTPGDGKLTTRWEYDRDSRMTYKVNDNKSTYAYY